MPKKNTKPQISGEKRGNKKNTPFLKDSAGGHKAPVQNFRVYLSKTAWTLEREGIWGFTLEPVCMFYGATGRDPLASAADLDHCAADNQQKTNTTRDTSW